MLENREQGLAVEGLGLRVAAPDGLFEETPGICHGYGAEGGLEDVAETGVIIRVGQGLQGVDPEADNVG